MSFVKDDSSRSRGVGAIASIDMGSPRRRLAAARAGRALAQRDAVMARSTLGRVPLLTSPATGTYGTTLKQPTGPSGGGGAPPVVTVGEKWSPTTTKSYTPPPASPPAPLRSTKLPGSVATAETKNGRTTVVNGSGSVDVKPTAPLKSDAPPSKTTTVIVGGGGGAPWTGVGPAAPAPMVVPPLDPMPELPDDGELAPSTAPTKPKTSGNTLMYAALGIGALWLLTRE